MKTQLLFVAASLFSFAAAAQTSDLATRQLRGKVKSITEVEYEVVEKFGEPEKGKKKTIDYREYNTAGNETEHQLEDFTRAGAKTAKSFRYRDKTKLVEIREEKEGKISLTKIEYNPAGKIGTVAITDSKGSLEQRHKYRYDAAGLLTQIDFYKGDGSLSSKYVYTHNAKKQLARKESYEAGDLFDVRTYSYDADGNLVQETDLNFWSKTTDTITHGYRYNEKKQKVEESTINSREKLDLMFNNYTLIYNEQGDLLSKSSFLEVETIAYTYDKYNNWIKAVKTSGPALEIKMFEKTQVIVERQIKYY